MTADEGAQVPPAHSDPRAEDILRTDLALRDAEVERLRGEVHAEHTINTGLNGDFAAANAEVGRLRGLLAEVTPYAIAGADALDHWEPYGDAQGEDYNRLRDGAAVMLERLSPGGEIRREAGLT